MDATELIARHRAASDAAAADLEARWWAGRLVWRPPQPGKVQIVAIKTYARMTQLKRYILMEVEP